VAVIGRRLLYLVLVLLAVSFLILLLTELVPGDPALYILGESASDEQVANVHHQMGLDQPLPERYVRWVGNAVHGDLGRSIRTQQPVWEMIKARIPVSLELALLTVGVALILALPLGMYAANRAEGPFDRATGSLAAVTLSSPPFLTAIILVYVLSVELKWLPIAGWIPLTEDPWENLRHVALPVLASALFEVATWSRILRADMVDTLDQDHVMAARAIGLPNRQVLFRYALRPSSFSLVTVSGISLGRLIGGTVIIETIFALPGLGQLVYTSINNKDLVVVQGAVLFVATVYVVLSTLISLAYRWLDPRIRTAERHG
jgi:peptide/nickel transport system permease protein